MPHNPFARWRITGTWANHMSYSLGGEDYPLPYGTPLPAPAAGTLVMSGRPRPFPEFQCGQVGSAGRRSILMLDTSIRDVVAVVFQHQSAFAVAQHYDEGQTCGWSGASANGQNYGGDVHLHIHCLTAAGQRRKFTDYFPALANTSPAPKPAPLPAPAPIPDENEDEMRQFEREKTGKSYFIAKQYVKSVADAKTREIGEYALDEPTRRLNEDDFERVLNAHGVPVERFLEIADDPQGGWSAERGRFAETSPFGVLARSWDA